MRLSLPLLALPLLVSVSCALLACGTQIGLPDANDAEVQLPPLFSVPSFEKSMAYTIADDVDDKTPGLQVRVVLEVHDEEWGRHIPEVQLMNTRGETYSARTRTEGFGRVAVFESVGVAASKDGMRNNWLFFVANDDESEASPRDTAVDEDDVEPVILEHEVLKHEVLGVGDVQFPFACGQVLEARSMKEMWAMPRGICISLQGDFRVTNSTQSELPTLPSVVEVRGDLVVQDCSNLRTLRALNAIGRVQGDVRVQGNEVLPTAEAEALVAKIGTENIEGRVVIVDNAEY